MSARLLLTEHISPDVAEQLRARGIDAVAVSDRPELRGRADGDILGAAAAEDRAVVTRNLRDFLPSTASGLARAAAMPGSCA